MTEQVESLPVDALVVAYDEPERKPCGCPEDTPTAQIGEAGVYRCWSCNKVFIA